MTRPVSSLVTSLSKSKDVILVPVAHTGARLVWGPVMAAIPPAGLDAFGKLSVRDVLEFPADHAERKGDPSDARTFRTGTDCVPRSRL